MIVLVLISLIGVTMIIADSTITRPLRRFWPEFFGCCQCVGFWVGAIAGAGGIVVMTHIRPLDVILVGAATSFLSLLSHGVILQLLGESEEELSQ